MTTIIKFLPRYTGKMRDFTPAGLVKHRTLASPLAKSPDDSHRSRDARTDLGMLGVRDATWKRLLFVWSPLSSFDLRMSTPTPCVKFLSVDTVLGPSITNNAGSFQSSCRNTDRLLGELPDRDERAQNQE
jgi:hypothetical protein